MYDILIYANIADPSYCDEFIADVTFIMLTNELLQNANTALV